MKPGYTVEFIWIMSKYMACRREDSEELVRTPSIRSLISQHRSRIDELLRCFDNEAAAPNPDVSTPARLD